MARSLRMGLSPGELEAAHLSPSAGQAHGGGRLPRSPPEAGVAAFLVRELSTEAAQRPPALPKGLLKSGHVRPELGEGGLDGDRHGNPDEPMHVGNEAAASAYAGHMRLTGPEALAEAIRQALQSNRQHVR